MNGPQPLIDKRIAHFSLAHTNKKKKTDKIGEQRLHAKKFVDLI